MNSTSSVPRLRLAPWGTALLLAAVAGPLAAQAAPASQNARFGWVNSQLIIRQVPGYAAAESTLNLEIGVYRTEVQRMQTQLDSMIRAYDQQQIALSSTSRTAKQQEIREMQQRLEQRYTELQNQLLTALDRDLLNLANWQAVTNLINLDNGADYYLLNIYCSMWDWPGNNFVLARERSSGPLSLAFGMVFGMLKAVSPPSPRPNQSPITLSPMT